MKTLHLSMLNVWDMGYGRGRTSTYYFLKRCVEWGHEVIFLTCADEYQEQDERLRSEQIRVNRFTVPFKPIAVRYLWNISLKAFWLLFVFAASIRLYRLAKTFQPNLIYAHTPFAALPSFFVSKLVGVPYVLRLYGTSISTTGNWSLWSILRNLEFVISVRLPADRYVVTDDGTAADKVLVSLGVPKEKIEFWVNGVDKALKHESDPSFRNRLAPDDTRVLLTVSRLVEWKGTELVIRALPPLISGLQGKVLLLIVGDGPSKGRLKQLCNEIGVDRHVRFEGAVPHGQVWLYIDASDVFVSMNSLSSISNPVLEAMVMGKVVVALNAGDTSRLIRNYDTGILCDSNQAARLHEQLVAVLVDQGLRTRIGTRAREYILGNWPSWQERIDREVNLMQDVVAGYEKATKQACSL